MGAIKRIAIVILISFGLLSIFQLAQAQEIYKWIDEKGTTHYSEDPNAVPEKYKNKAQKKDIDEFPPLLPDKLKRPQSYSSEPSSNTTVEKTQRSRGKCEIISYSQYDVSGGSGFISGNVWRERKETCLNIVIQNNDRETKTITEQNIVATTSRKVVTRWKSETVGVKPHIETKPAETRDDFNPKAVFIQIRPGETYRGSICFSRQLPIERLELQGL
jgi:hypothetical protein